MANSLFNNKALSLLRDEMCICLEDLQSKLISDALTKLKFFSDFFDFLAELNPPHKNAELGSYEYDKNDEYINSQILAFAEAGGIEANSQEYFILDSIRHAFISFKSHGLLHLYKSREAENWYPKIVIRKKLGSNPLNGDVVIYRGTSKSEFEHKRFSQSWTLSQKIAHDFAFKHYQDHDAYKNMERVLIRAKINVLDIYYYGESDNENEVIIDERKIVDPTVISEGILA